MRILHTSDWHLGRTLFTRKRHDEHERFLAWLKRTIVERQIEALLVAGDIFDSTTPSPSAQALYYKFLGEIRGTCCRHVVLIGGNHDSASLLDAPREILQCLDVHVVGSRGDDLEKEIVELKDEAGQQAAIVCAVPYLRDRDVRAYQAGESAEDRDREVVQGIREHYQQVCDLALKRRKNNAPIIAMGHLFTAGGKTTEGDGVRELYVGSLGHVGADAFPPCIDYLALGHLHVAQQVNGSACHRYSGSPLPMNFGEAAEHKQVICLTIEGEHRIVEQVPVERFRRLERVKGNLAEIQRHLEQLKAEKECVWVEVVYDGNDVVGNLNETINALVEGSEVDVLRATDERIADSVTLRSRPRETLQDLKPMDVFLRRLDEDGMESPLRESMLETFSEACLLLEQEEPGADD